MLSFNAPSDLEQNPDQPVGLATPSSPEEPFAPIATPDPIDPLAPPAPPAQVDAIYPNDAVSPNPLFQELNRPWQEQQQAQQDEENKWFTDNMDRLHAASLDPDSHLSELDLSFTPDRKEAQRTTIVDSYLTLFNKGEYPRGGELGRNLFRDQIAEERFGGIGVGDDAAFYGEIQREAQKTNEAKEVHRSLLNTAIQSAIVGTVDTTGRGTPSFEKWRREAASLPGYNPATDDFRLMTLWKQAQDQSKEDIAPFKDALADVWQSLQKGDLYSKGFEHYEKLTDDQRDKFVGYLNIIASTLPADQARTLWDNFITQSKRDIGAQGRGFYLNAEQTGQGQMDEAYAWLGLTGSDHRTDEQKAADAKQSEYILSGKKARLYREFIDEVNSIRDGVYDPIKTHFSGNWAAAERGIYSAPGMLTTSAMAWLPGGLGVGATFINLEDSVNSEIRQRLVSSGMGRAEARELAPKLSIPVAALQLIPEMFGAELIARRIPVLNKLVDSISDRIANRALRFATTTAVITTLETGTEHLQDFTTLAVQDFVAALNKEVPGVNWQKEYQGFWTKNLELMVGMFPMSLFGAAGGLNADARAKAFANASDLQLRAFGIQDEDAAKIREAAKKGPASLHQAIDQAMENRTPESEQSRQAVEQLTAQLKAQQAAQQVLKNSNLIPRIIEKNGTWTVVDPTTGEEIGQASSMQEAIGIVESHTSALDERSADQTASTAQDVIANEQARLRRDVVETSMQAVEQVNEKIGDQNSTTELNLGEQKTTEDLTDEKDIERATAQAAAKDTAAGGDGKAPRAIWGRSFSEFKNDVFQTVNRIFAGGSVLTVFHEKGHEQRRKAYMVGAMTRADEIAMYRSLDQVLAGKLARTKDGKPGESLRLIPEGLTDEQVTEEMLDEAFSQLIEAEIIRSSRVKDGGKLGLPPGLVSRNLTALAKLMSPKAMKSWRSLLAAMRHFWGVAFGRAHALQKAIRDGKVDAQAYHEFLAKGLGLDSQNQYDEAVQEEVKRLAAEGDSFPLSSGKSPSFSIGQVHTGLKSKTAIITGKSVEDLERVPDDPKSSTMDRALESVSAIHAKLGNVLSSPRSWATFVHALAGKLGKRTEMLVAPQQAMEYNKGSGFGMVLDDLVKHPEYLESREAGLATATEILKRFRSGDLGREDLAGLFAWGLLSRGVGAYFQEGGYLALHKAGLLDQIRDFFAGKITPDDVVKWGLAATKNTPGVSTSQNTKALGAQLEALAQDIDGRPAIDHLLDLWRSDLTGPELRREVFRLFPSDRKSIQIQNKVLSFIILVSGRPDVLVLDRIQFRHLWGGSEVDGMVAKIQKQVAKAKAISKKQLAAAQRNAKGKPSDHPAHAELAAAVERNAAAQALDDNPDNIYDALPVFEDDGSFKMAIKKNKETGKDKVIIVTNGIAPAGNGLHGMAIYEALERNLTDAIRSAYVSRGISYPGIGAFHWDSWLVTSQQAISHPTLAVVGKIDTSPSVGVQQGKFNQIDYGTIFRYDGTYVRELLTAPGAFVSFSEETRKKLFTAAQVQKAIGRKIPLEKDLSGKDRTRPWTEELNADERQRFDTFLRSLGTTFSRETLEDAAADGGGESGLGNSAAARIAAIGQRFGYRIDHRPRSGEDTRGSDSNDRGGVLTPEEFVSIGAANKAAHPFGASVDVKNAPDYSGYDLIVVRDGGETATISVSPDGEVGSVTKSPGGKSSLVAAAFDAAKATGNVAWLNGFDTVLPGLYSALGFAPVARVKFDPNYQPEGWSEKTFAKFNQGQPDVVFMRYTGTPVKYRLGDAPYVDSYDEGVAAATKLKAAPTFQPLGPAFSMGPAPQLDADFIEEHGRPVASRVEARRLWAEGKLIYVADEMEDALSPVTSREMLDSYTTDLMLWLERSDLPQPDPSFSLGPAVPDYGINHRPNEEGPRAFDLAEGGVSPADVYDHPEWYSSMDPKVIRETMSQLKAARGKPDADLTIYRAGPKGEMNPGDWVSLSREYARTHAMGIDPEDSPRVWSATVKAADVRWDMNDLAEFGYFGKPTKAQDTQVAFSLGPAAMSDALAGEAINRVRNPIQRAHIFQGMAERLAKLKRDKDEIVQAFGKPTERRAIAGNGTLKSLREEAAKRQAARRAELEDQARTANAGGARGSKGKLRVALVAARAQAKQETKAWLEQAIKDQETNFSPKARLLRAMQMLDAIVMSLPIAERGRLGGHTTLANLDSDEKRLEYLQTRIAKADEVVEKFLQREYGRLMNDLLERSKPTKDEAGKKRVGKIGGDAHDLFDKVRAALTWTVDEGNNHADALEALIQSGTLTPEQEAHATLEAHLIPLVADWKNADAARRASAVVAAQSIYSGAYIEFQIAKLRQREMRQVVREQLIAATGKDGTRSERLEKAAKDNKLPGRWKDSILGLMSFEQIVHFIFGQDSAEARNIVDAERAASNQKEDALQEKLQAIEDLFTRLAGGNKLAGEKLRWNLSQPSINFRSGKFSQLEAITATLMWRQPDGRRHMEGKKDENGKVVSTWGYTQADIDALENALTPEAKEVRQFLSDQYAAEWAAINPTYRALHGVNLPSNPNYSPLTVKPQQAPAGQTVDPVSGFGMSGSSTTPGSLRTRGQAIAEPDFKDALQVYIAHTKQIQHWLAYAPMVNDAQAILGNRELGNSVEAKAGEQAAKILRSWLDHFAQGGSRDAAAHLALTQALARMTGRAATVALVGRLGTLAIQVTQLGAALVEMPVGSYLLRLGKLLSGQMGWGEAFRSDYIQRRMAEQPPIVRQALEGLKASKPNLLKSAVQHLGSLIGGTDALFTAGTYAMVYDYQLKQAKKMGLAGADAEAHARQAAERITDRLAQPTRAGARSLFENTSTNPMAKISWAFASEARKNFGLLAYNLSQRDAATKAKTVAFVLILNSLMGGLIRNAWRDVRDDDDEEVFDAKHWSLERLGLTVATEPFYGIPVVGSLIQSGAFKLAGEYQPEGNALSSAGAAFQALSHIDDTVTGQRDIDQVMKDVEAILSGMGLFSDNAAAAASLSHLIRDLFGVGSNLLE